MYARHFIALACAGLGFGCSTHPLPEDFSRATTYDIFQSIRCEVKNGLLNFNADFPASEGGASGRFPDEPFLADTQIAYDFSFTIDESNKANEGMLNFENSFGGGGSFKLDFTGTAEKVRQNIRSFGVTESLAELRASGPCEIASLRNLLHPIAGRVGVDEVVTTYLQLERDYRFRQIIKGPDGKVFSDVLTFTTELTAGAKPTLTLNAGSSKFKLRQFSLNGNVRRNDMHKLTIAIATVTNSGGFTGGKKLVIYDFSTRTFRRSPPVARLSGGNPAKDLVLEEIYRLRALEDDRQRFDIVAPVP